MGWAKYVFLLLRHTLTFGTAPARSRGNKMFSVPKFFLLILIIYFL